MESFKEYMDEYKKQIDRGYIQQAYKGLMEYFRGLKIYFNSHYPEYSPPGSLYQGYMDMTYFPLFPKSLKDKNLKIAVVFNYEAFRFEVWLAGANRKIQAEYWKLFKEIGPSQFRVPATTKGTDSIVEHTLVDRPDFTDLDALTKRIDAGTKYFIKEVENFLSRH